MSIYLYLKSPKQCYREEWIRIRMDALLIDLIDWHLGGFGSALRYWGGSGPDPRETDTDPKHSIKHGSREPPALTLKASQKFYISPLCDKLFFPM